jgi:hypothetical protein
MSFPDSEPVDRFDKEYDDTYAAKLVQRSLSVKEPSKLSDILEKITQKLKSIGSNHPEKEAWREAFLIISEYYLECAKAQKKAIFDEDGKLKINIDEVIANDAAFLNIVKDEFPENFTKGL